ncbi:uncharacterized protein LOC123679851 [Harmonia axyridis]|uniref:uncharacterized protein LOC123679851 n=1 Tax=Harmonia axyridis TaxID=115357 RepID=UPI001E275436|nr:uncharacterized protein LOC123679851 [Harmonia axyridis]
METFRYSSNNITYGVTETPQIHQRLQNDIVFCQKYFEGNASKSDHSLSSSECPDSPCISKESNSRKRPRSESNDTSEEKEKKKTRNKSLYDHRKKMVEIEERRLDLLSQISKDLKEQTRLMAEKNRLTAERNDILRKLLPNNSKEKN